MSVLSALALVGMGFLAGGYGTVIGAGGGFLMVPLLLFTRPDLPPALVTTISQGAVMCNAVSGAWAYTRQKRIDYKSGLLFACATIPAAAGGALVVSRIPHGPFQLLFGVLLVLISLFIFFRGTPAPRPVSEGRMHLVRQVTDAKGNAYRWSYNLPLGMSFSLLIGFLASLLGIGGGILQVPVMVSILGFPAAIATATSTFLLLFTSLSGTVTHAAHGDFGPVAVNTALVALGMVVGAQIGARISQRLSSKLLVRLLAVALIFVGARLIQSVA